MVTQAPQRSTRPRPNSARGVRRGAPTHAVRRDLLRALTFNIGAAAEPRAAAIMAWLRRRSDDVVVLTETSRGPGTQLLVADLERRGYRTFSMPHDRDRGVVLGARIPVTAVLDAQMSLTLPCRAAGVVLDTDPVVAAVGVYVPSRDRSDVKIQRKRKFIDSLLASLGAFPAEIRDRLLVLGDYNAVARHHQPRLQGFLDYEYRLHAELDQLGLKAAHELCPHVQQPHSWIGRTGNGYLYDYAHAGAELHARVSRCAYLHGPRERRLSDHAALTVQVRLDAPTC